MRMLIALLAMSTAVAAQEKRVGDTVGFELKQNLIYVKATVNGVEGVFFWDTGASVTVVKPACAEKFGLKVGTAPFADAKTIGVGKAVVQDLPIAVIEVPQAAMLTYDGILGFNFISQFVTTLDYKKSTIRLEPCDYVPLHPAEALKLALAKGPATAGFSYRTIGDDEANEIGVEGGVVVSKVAAESPAEKAGLKKGDIIQEVNGRRCDTAEDWQKVLSTAKAGDVVKLSAIRDKKDVEIQITLEARK